MAEQTAATDERAVRRARRQALIDANVNPYPIKSEVSDHAAAIEERHAALEAGASTDDVVSVAGRIRALRNQGKVAFIVLEDCTGQIQLFCRSDGLREPDWALVFQLDLGDIIGATGPVMRTRRGQLSVSPTSLTLLSKSCRPLPEKFHGLTDREVRYRQRYVDLIMNPEVKETFVKRSRLISAMRRFMEGQGYLEVETPILQETLGGANARPFKTHFNALDQDCYLRIATELHLKRCIVGGMERVFELGRQFRNEGMDLTHNPEFTSMEAYCAYSDLEGMKRLTEGLFTACRQAVGLPERFAYRGTTVDLSLPFRSASMSELVSERVGEEVGMGTPVGRAREICERFGLEYDEGWGIGRLVFTLYDELCEGQIVDPTFVCDYPVEVSPLAKRKDDDPRLTERFEIVIAGHEYGNAFSELNDPVDQEGRFAAQVEAKAAGDDEAMDYDYDFVRALEYGMPPTGGIGWGVDRIVMLFTNAASIRDVLLFPHMRPEAGPHRSPVAPEVGDAVEGEVPPAPEASAPAPPDFSKVAIEPLFEDCVDFETFSKSDLRVVKVLACEAVPKSKKLLRFLLDDGTDEPRTILSGIHAYYEPQELVGRTCVAITNLPPRTMMGIDSCGMLISAVHEEEGEERLNLLMVDGRIPAGAKLY